MKLNRRALLLAAASVPTASFGQTTLGPSIFPRSVDVRSFGAVGDGVNDDTSAIQSAIDHAYSNGYSVVLFPRGPSFYRIDCPIICRSGVSLVGGPGKTLIRNTRTPYQFGMNQVFRCGNFHPAYTSSFRLHPISPLKSGDKELRLQDPDVLRTLKSGDTVVFASENRTPVSNLTIPAAMEFNEIVSIEKDGVLRLRYPTLQEGLTGIVLLSEGYPGRDSVDLFVFANATISDFQIETEGYWLADSATLNVKFFNLSIKSRALIYGNSFQRTQFTSIMGTFSTGCMEMGHNSILVNCSDFHFEYAGPRPSNRGTICIDLKENARGIVVENGFVDFTDLDSYFAVCIMNAANILIRNVDLRCNSDRRQYLIFLGGRQDKWETRCEWNLIENCRFLTGRVGGYLMVVNDGLEGEVGANVVRDNSFSGSPLGSGFLFRRVPEQLVSGNVFHCPPPEKVEGADVSTLVKSNRFTS